MISSNKFKSYLINKENEIFKKLVSCEDALVNIRLSNPSSDRESEVVNAVIEDLKADFKKYNIEWSLIYNICQELGLGGDLIEEDK